ncbi:MAG: antibiotic biosynthesis monooxygenase family protein [Candidatus Saccharibacteria bacterium]|nr:antibiotic biosynthesis monooxygenase family protein [Candidatus Saccharibacteria bacterium]
MNEFNIFMCGSWHIKPGEEDSFIKLWQDFANQSESPSAGRARLLRDKTNLSHFLSYRDWQSLEVVDEWRQSPEFKQFFTQVKKVVEKVDVYTLDKVADSEANK